MSIMTKKEIEAIECFNIGDNGCVTNKLPISKAEKRYLVYVEDFLALKETLEEAVEVIKSNRFQLGGHTGWDIAIDEGALKHNTETSLYLIREFLSQYEKEN